MSKCVHYEQIPGKKIENEEVRDVTMRVAVGPDDKAPRFTMRVFTVGRGGHSPRHTHDFEHEIFFHSGTGEVFHEGITCPVKAGSVAYVAPGDDHQIRNTGSEDLVFVCVVPNKV
jgi:quercetin dioxygenase-like cupin family protein